MNTKLKCKSLREMLHIENDVNFCTADGKCSNCGNCCSNVLPLTKVEIATIKQYIKKNKIKPIIHNSSQDVVDCVCPFRDEVNKKCIIYPVRPFICKDYQCNKDPLKEAMSMLHRNIDYKKFDVCDVRRTFFKIKETEESKTVHDFMLMKVMILILFHDAQIQDAFYII